MNKTEYTLRCVKCLGGRISVPKGATTARCPHCGQGWRITWVTSDVAKIRGRILPGEEGHGTSGSN